MDHALHLLAALADAAPNAVGCFCCQGSPLAQDHLAARQDPRPFPTELVHSPMWCAGLFLPSCRMFVRFLSAHFSSLHVSTIPSHLQLSTNLLRGQPFHSSRSLTKTLNKFWSPVLCLFLNWDKPPYPHFPFFCNLTAVSTAFIQCLDSL